MASLSVACEFLVAAWRILGQGSLGSNPCVGRWLVNHWATRDTWQLLGICIHTLSSERHHSWGWTAGLVTRVTEHLGWGELKRAPTQDHSETTRNEGSALTTPLTLELNSLTLRGSNQGSQGQLESVSWPNLRYLPAGQWWQGMAQPNGQKNFCFGCYPGYRFSFR